MSIVGVAFVKLAACWKTLFNSCLLWPGWKYTKLGVPLFKDFLQMLLTFEISKKRPSKVMLTPLDA